MQFADIHIHALACVDDGAKNVKVMQDIIDAAYADGTRVICFTPHWYPVVFLDNRAAAKAAYYAASEYIQSKGYGIRIALGNELRYVPGCASWLNDNLCRTLNGSRYILVDFCESETVDNIVSGVRRILNSGYKPVLAHVERYEKLCGNMREIRQLKADGALIQIDSRSLTGDFGFWCKLMAKRCLSEYLADVVASDAHDTSRRPPQLSDAFECIARKYSPQYAKDLMWDTPLKILGMDNI